ncbi:MAG: multidrug ABC transporter permease/ATP-binding protein [Halomonas sp.]|nr:multidrug ABC transporter permease/ATP-binding protein [Halomonas sp.]MDN6298119.1 multidrug ABC transporter permease/ATP-binding protein [Halomonas sp.]MDN6315434.1 multidrug ABC transporter permease/ATP-binding protein [Halomonas sp.]MDN6336738.1 multidrug ABC transporter permease/ATP-binding protein [Halomonas sp.]
MKELATIIWRDYRLAFIGVVLLSLVSAGLGVGVIAFINQRLLAATDAPLSVLPQFLGLIALLLGVTLGSQLALTTLGHRFVFHLRGRLIKRILDTDIGHLEQLGGARLLASLATDVRYITVAFVRLPELVQGGVLTVGAALYLGWLSLPLLGITVLWVTFTMAVGLKMVARVYREISRVRNIEDRLYENYQAVIDGRKELALNRDRAEWLYRERYTPNAEDYRRHIVLSDTFHLSAVNWFNIMMLGAIGVVFFLASGLGWASLQVATTFSLTLLFLRAPLIQAVGAFPTLINARVAFEKLESLGLADHAPGFHKGGHQGGRASAAPGERAGGWQRLALRGASYRYPAGEAGPGFAIGPLDLTLERGEVVFVIGGNGSGKSTLARLLTGLYTPDGGTFELDGTPLSDSDWPAYRRGISAIYTDFYLFDQLIGPGGEAPAGPLVEGWLQALGMEEKLDFDGDRVISTHLSQGQRKRLAMLLAVAEQRDLLLLDEWAADQDPQFRRVFYRELLPRLRALGKTVVVISHDDHYFDAADRLLEMRHGKLYELTGEERAAASRDAVARLDATARPAEKADGVS